MITRKQRILFAGKVVLGICFSLTSVLASAQTLTVVLPTRHSVSPRLSDIHGGNSQVKGATEIPHHPLPLQANYQNGGRNGEEEEDSSGTAAADPVQQTSFGPLVAAATGDTFDGLSVNEGHYIPSDNNIAVGPDHIVETVNAAYAIYDKLTYQLLKSGDLRSLWTTLGGSCSVNNGGDPIVQYDRAADRWMITQLGSLRNPYSECIAVSTTPDPEGTYNLYSYSFGSYLNDYPKFGVWPTATNSAYLATYNLFAGGASFAGAEICAYDRDKMLSGDPTAAVLCYTGISGASYLPADLDGATPPPDGTPAYFVDLYTTASLGVYEMTPNFAHPNATKLSKFSTIPVAPFSTASSVPQPATSRLLDALSDRLMYRLAFRMFSNHASIVVNHSVQTDSRSGVRWYELRAPLSGGSVGSFSRYQQGTYALTSDSDSRWMGSAAMDQDGDIAIGYSVSSSSTFPSLRYTGRFPTDTLGDMQSEASLYEGTGSQTGYSRWGDYSSLRIDPSDDCTFWYVNEYLPQTSSYGWYTRIGSFKFDGCGGTSDPVHDLAVTSVNVPSPVFVDVEQTVTVSVVNQGNQPETFDVSLSDPSASTISTTPQTNISLAGGASTTLSFAWTPNIEGTHVLTATASTVSGETDLGDNTKTANSTVNPAVHDVAVTAVSAPATAATGATESVSVTVKNEGSFSESFNVSLATTGGGTITDSPQSVSNLDSGASQTLTFQWNTGSSEGDQTLTATATLSGDADPGDNSNSTTSTVILLEATQMHVADLDAASVNNGNTWTANVSIVVRDGRGNLVDGATVTGTWSDGASGSASCVTGSNPPYNNPGQCWVGLLGIRKRNGSVTFTVNGVTHATLTYNPAANSDPDGDSNGTTIVVNKP